MLNLTITEGKLGEFPPVTKPHPGFYYEVGEERFRELVNAHYDLIRESDIAFLFPVDDEDFAEAQKHAADFLIQICGGPNYFEQTRGEARLVVSNVDADQVNSIAASLTSPSVRLTAPSDSRSRRFTTS